MILLGCPGKKDKPGETSRESSGTNEVDVRGDSVSVPENQLPGSTGDAGGDLLDPELHGQAATGYTPTRNKPLAPPAQAAAGSNDVAEGEVRLVASAAGSDGQEVPLTTGATIRVADTMRVQVTLVNRSSETVEVVFATSQKLDIVLTDQQGREAYRWSSGMRFAQVVNSLIVEPGNSWIHELTLGNGPEGRTLEPGVYTIKVVITGTPEYSFTAEDIHIEPA
jgi:hypothetical protein